VRCYYISFSPPPPLNFVPPTPFLSPVWFDLPSKHLGVFCDPICGAQLFHRQIFLLVGFYFSILESKHLSQHFYCPIPKSFFFQLTPLKSHLRYPIMRQITWSDCPPHVLFSRMPPILLFLAKPWGKFSPLVFQYYNLSFPPPPKDPTDFPDLTDTPCLVKIFNKNGNFLLLSCLPPRFDDIFPFLTWNFSCFEAPL